MRSLLVLLLFAPLLAAAQPEPDEPGVRAAFAELLDFAQADSLEAVRARMVCPLESDDGEVEVVACRADLADHRARVENGIEHLRRLFPGTTDSLESFYGAEAEGEMEFHLLVYQNLPGFALLTFMEADGAYRFAEAQLEAPLRDLAPPPSLVQTFESLALASVDPAVTMEEFARFVVARGTDETRAWKTVADPTRPDEQQTVASVRAAMQELLVKSEGAYEILRYGSERESEGTWHVIHVRFGEHADAREAAIAFLPIGPDFLLGDIDD